MLQYHSGRDNCFHFFCYHGLYCAYPKVFMYHYSSPNNKTKSWYMVLQRWKILTTIYKETINSPVACYKKYHKTYLDFSFLTCQRNCRPRCHCCFKRESMASATFFLRAWRDSVKWKTSVCSISRDIAEIFPAWSHSRCFTIGDCSPKTCHMKKINQKHN